MIISHLLGFLFIIPAHRISMSAASEMYSIATLWDGDAIRDNEEVNVKFSSGEIKNASGTIAALLIEIDSPHYKDPVIPSSIPVGSTDKLWDYEVVEVFFLSESEGWYLETEFAPTGHYLLLQLDTARNVLKYELPLDNYTAKVDPETGRWTGKALIPLDYLPKDVNKFNAYAIHKTDPKRVYLSLFPTPKGKYDTPNFHRLEYFQKINMNSILGYDTQ